MAKTRPAATVSTVGLQKFVTTPPTLHVKSHASTTTHIFQPSQLDEMVLSLTDLGRNLTASRQKNQQLSPAARAAISGPVAAGASQCTVAAALGVSHVLVANTIERFTTTASFNSKHRAGRPMLSHDERNAPKGSRPEGIVLDCWSSST